MVVGFEHVRAQDGASYILGIKTMSQRLCSDLCCREPLSIILYLLIWRDEMDGSIFLIMEVTAWMDSGGIRKLPK